MGTVVKERSRRCHVYRCGCCWMEHDLRNPLCGIESHSFPCAARVCCTVDAITNRDAVTRPWLSCPHPHSVGSCLINGYRTDRLVVVVKHRCEGRTPSCRFPYSTACCANVEATRRGIDHCDIRNTSAHDGRTDAARTNWSEHSRSDLLCCCRQCGSRDHRADDHTDACVHWGFSETATPARCGGWSVTSSMVWPWRPSSRLLLLLGMRSGRQRAEHLPLDCCTSSTSQSALPSGSP